MRALGLDRLLTDSCRVCGWTTMPDSELCVGCLDIREWSRVNRAFCDVLHRALVPAVRLVDAAGRLVDAAGRLVDADGTEMGPVEAGLAFAGAAAE